MAQSTSAIQVVALRARHPSLSPAQFKKYYLENHAPIAQKTMGPSAAPAGFRLTFLTQPAAHELMGVQAGYDAIEELRFRDQQHYEAWKSRADEVWDLLAEDWANFLMSQSTRSSFRVWMIAWLRISSDWWWAGGVDAKSSTNAAHS